MNKVFPLRKARIAVPNHEVRALLWDFYILRQVAQSGAHNKASSLPHKALKACNRILDIWDSASADPTTIARMATKCRQIAGEVLGEYPAQEADGHTQVWMIGHCHIDTAWLWRYSQSQQKVARSWATQCDLMDRWHSFRFSASSAQHFYWLESLYPQIFHRVKSYVDKGQFNPVGGSWVEHDCLLPSGESLVRQYLYGQRYFHSRFGQYCREAWLPDTFGYAAQLPQILRSVGIDYFFTHKLSWNNMTEFPYTTMNWVSLDGSQVLAHLSPVGTYNAACDYAEILKTVWNHKNLGDTDQSMILYGNGDGGGGPNEQHLERVRNSRYVQLH